MMKKLTLWIFFAPVVLFAQTGISKDGVITLDFNKKKTASDTVQKKQSNQQQDYLKPAKQKKQDDLPQYDEEEEAPDFKKDGLFKALFHAGINGCQVDGDGYSGFKYMGFDGGVGAMIRFHKLFSASMEINYTMKGSRQTYLPHASDSSQYKFNIQWDYIEVPISISVHDKKLVMFSLGIAPAFMIRYKQRSENGQNETDNPPSGQPSRFDLSVFGMLNFVIQKHYALGIKYGYSTIPIRSSSGYGFSKIRGQYNNVLTLRFTYIMDSVKKKKK